MARGATFTFPGMSSLNAKCDFYLYWTEQWWLRRMEKGKFKQRHPMGWLKNWGEDDCWWSTLLRTPDSCAAASNACPMLCADQTKPDFDLICNVPFHRCLLLCLVKYMWLQTASEKVSPVCITEHKFSNYCLCIANLFCRILGYWR